jgi:uncharacterized XkdX family phage protein
MSIWNSMLKKMYGKGKATKESLKNAVIRGWITADEYKEITGEEYVA